MVATADCGLRTEDRAQSMFRQALLRATSLPAVRRFITSDAAARQVALRFVAGETLDEGVAAVRRLTQLGEDSPVTAWSPDGKRIAILAGGGIYVMNADGSDFQNVDQHGGHGAIDWRR